MARRVLRLVSVGKLRIPHWKTAAEQYTERLERWWAVQQITVPDGNPALSPRLRSEDEAARLLGALAPTDQVVCMDERGKNLGSRQFAALFASLAEDATKTPCFVVGGAFGLTGAVRERARHVIALGPMTLTHELARVVLLEQLYRAETINRNIPYHHD